jgi:hypothetical protein
MACHQLGHHPHLYHCCHFLPLLRTRVHSRGVVSTGMQEEDTLLWNFLKRKPRNTFLFWWDWGLNSGLYGCKAGAPPLQPHLQSSSGYFGNGFFLTICPSWPQLWPFQVVRITGISHGHLVRRLFFFGFKGDSYLKCHRSSSSEKWQTELLVWELF